MSSETSKKQRAAAALAQGREKQIRNITDNEEPVPKDLLSGESVKRTYKLDTIYNLQEALGLRLGLGLRLVSRKKKLLGLGLGLLGLGLGLGLLGLGLGLG
jgi:hypothetical protein